MTRMYELHEGGALQGIKIAFFKISFVWYLFHNYDC